MGEGAELRDLWHQVLRRLEKRIGHQDVEIWLRGAEAQASRWHGRDLVVEVANRYYADWIRDNYLAAVEAEVEAEVGHPVRVELVHQEEPTAEPPKPSPAGVDRLPTFIGLNPAQTLSPSEGRRSASPDCCIQ